MSLTVPLTSELSSNIIAQLEASLSQLIPLLPKAFLRVLAKVLSGVIILVYRYAGFIFLQMFISTASFRETVVNGKTIRPLVEWGRQVGVGDPGDAERAELVTQVTVTNQTGFLTAGSQLLRAETQVIYQVVADTALDAATIDVTVKAVSGPLDSGGAGSIGNLEDGDTIDFANPLPNVATTTTIQSTTTAGADAETEEAYRARVLEHEQARPQGGAYADYRRWAQQAAEVNRAYPYTSDSPGEVDVFIEAPITEANPDGLPDGDDLAAALAAINLDVDGLATQRSANSQVNTIAITRTGFTVEVAGLISPNLATTQAAITEGVDEYLRSREPFILGLSVLPRLDRITQGSIAGVVAEIVDAQAATVNSVTLKLSTLVITQHTLGEGEKAKLFGSVVFT